MIFSCCAFFILFFIAGTPAHAEKQNCLPMGSVKESPYNNDDFLSRESAENIKAILMKMSSYGLKKRLDGDSIIIVACPSEDYPSEDVLLLTVSGGDDEIEGEIEGEGVAFSWEYFTDLAAKTGHTKQEADTLYKKYARLKGSFRYVMDEKTGKTYPESKIIWESHKKRLGIGKQTLSSANNADYKKKADALKKRIDAAEAKGDMSEMMKLAAEAQQLNAPVYKETGEMMENVSKQTWQLLESVYPDLLQAIYPTSIKLNPLRRCSLECEWPGE